MIVAVMVGAPIHAEPENSDACLDPVLDWDQAIMHPHTRDQAFQ